jgi:hypothetical protein
MWQQAPHCQLVGCMKSQRCSWALQLTAAVDQRLHLDTTHHQTPAAAAWGMVLEGTLASIRMLQKHW